MAGKLKEITKFSEDAISIAVNNLSNEKKEAFLNGLNTIHEALGKKQPKQKSEKKKITDDDIFINKIVPLIQKKVAMIEAGEMDQQLELSTTFDIDTRFDTFSISDLRKVHSKIVAQEENFKDATLLLQFFRGQLYLTLNRKIRKEGLQWKKFVEQDMSCSYMTVLRYMTLASVISSYPRLLLCNLTFAQILKHRERIYKFLESEKESALRDQLSMSFDINVQGTIMHIGCVSVPMPPKQKYSFNPDWEHQEETPHAKTEQWIESVGAMGTDQTNNDLEEMETFIRLVIYFCSCCLQGLLYTCILLMNSLNITAAIFLS